MSTPPRKRFDDNAALNLTPMIDVTFLLIIFFLCVTEMARAEYEELILPKAVMGIVDRPPLLNRQIINVVRRQSNGGEATHVIVRGRQYDRTRDLVAHLKAVCQHSETRGEEPVSVKIRADSGAAYAEVQQVMVACMKAGISRISIGTAPERH